VHELEHPSPLVTLPSSHCSAPRTKPSPHVAVHALGPPAVAAQVNPISTAHVAEHPSPLA
jgi:hypothetical protein